MGALDLDVSCCIVVDFVASPQTPLNPFPSRVSTVTLCPLPGAPVVSSLAIRRDRHRKRVGKVAHMRAAKVFKADRDRCLAIEYVKTHIIEGFLPFDFLEHEERKNFYLLATSNEESPFPVERLDSKGVSSRKFQGSFPESQAPALGMRPSSGGSR